MRTETCSSVWCDIKALCWAVYFHLFMIQKKQYGMHHNKVVQMLLHWLLACLNKTVIAIVVSSSLVGI